MAISIITEFSLKIFGKKAHLQIKIVIDSDRRRIGKGLLTQSPETLLSIDTVNAGDRY